MELHAEFESEACNVADGLGIVAVDVEDGGFDEFGDVGAVARRACVGRIGGETYLVIDDEVDGAAGAIAGELGEVERLGHDALTCEGGVAVYQERAYTTALDVAADALAGAGLAFDDRVDDLEVRRVGGETDLDGFARSGLQLGLVAEVVFHISVAADGVGDVVFGELFEEHLERFAENIGQDGEATAVGHAHDDLLDADLGRELDHRVERGDHRFAAFEGEPFLPDETCVEKLLEELGFVQTAEDADLLLAGERRLVVAGLHAGLEPLAGVVVLHVHVFDADATAVGLLEGGGDVLELLLSAALEVGESEALFEVAFVETEVGKLEFRMRGGGFAERVNVGLKMTVGTVGVDVSDDLRLFVAIDDFDPRSGGATEPGAVAAEGETLEKRAPRRIDGIGIGQPCIVGCFDRLGIGACGERQGVHGEEMSPSKPTFCGVCRRGLLRAVIMENCYHPVIPTCFTQVPSRQLMG